MGTAVMTRSRVALALALLSVMLAVPARAQDASVILTLDRQTPFATAKDPVIEVVLVATNTGDEPLEDLEVGFVLGTEVRTRGEVETAMDPANALTLQAGEARRQEGSLEPGRSRTFETRIDVLKFGVRPAESLIYPMAVDLRSHDTVVAELRTPVLFFFQRPFQPLSFAWTIELAPPIAFGPEGFVDDTIEGEIASGGRIAAQVGLIRQLAEDGTAANVVLSPVLVSTLRRMAGGYVVGDREVPAGVDGSGRAQELLSSLRRSLAAPRLAVSLYPFAAPQLPAMLRSGLTRDLDLQIDRGRDLVGSALGVTSSSTAVRGPDGELDGNAIQRLAADGATTLLVEADSVERPAQPLDFAPLPTAAMDVPGSGDPLALVLPDPGAQAVLGSDLPTADPVLAAQQTLGALAAIWQEQKVPPEGTVRGAAISLTEDLSLPARFWEALGRRVAGAPFLDVVTGEGLVERIPPVGTAELLAPSTGSFSAGYVEAIRQERRRIEALRAVAPQDEAADALAENLLYAEAGAYVGDEDSGRAWIDATHAATERVFVRAAPLPDQVFTVASGTVAIPLRIPGSPGPPLSVRIQLKSAGLRFPDGDAQDTVITDEDRVLSFRIEATGAGQIPVSVLVLAPNGRVLSESTLVVRSTAFNRVALAITAVAALALIALWLRRLMARRAAS